MNRGRRGTSVLFVVFFCCCCFDPIYDKILGFILYYLVALSLAPALSHAECLHKTGVLKAAKGLSQITSLGANNYICQNLKGTLTFLSMNYSAVRSVLWYIKPLWIILQVTYT